MKHEPLVIERVFQSPVSRVWKAITETDQIRQWSFNMVEFRPEPGFEFKFEGGKDDIVFHHVCKVVEVIPEKKLSYSWRYEGYEGNSLVTIELFAEGVGTRLRLTHSGLETFPQDSTDFARENYQEGWNQIIGTSLKGFLEKAS